MAYDQKRQTNMVVPYALGGPWRGLVINVGGCIPCEDSDYVYGAVRATATLRRRDTPDGAITPGAVLRALHCSASTALTWERIYIFPSLISFAPTRFLALPSPALPPRHPVGTRLAALPKHLDLPCGSASLHTHPLSALRLSASSSPVLALADYAHVRRSHPVTVSPKEPRRCGSRCAISVSAVPYDSGRRLGGAATPP